MKWKLYERLKKNRFTNALIENLLILVNNESLRESLMNDLVDLALSLDLKTNKSKEVLNKIKIVENEEFCAGEIDSIKYCVKNRHKHSNLHKILHLIIKYK